MYIFSRAEIGSLFLYSSNYSYHTPSSGKTNGPAHLHEQREILPLDPTQKQGSGNHQKMEK